MAVYHGFFDAAIDVSTGEYDRKYGAEDFTQYFERIVGTGVCVYENPDSLKAFYDSSGQKVMVNPGYAFIRGYWLKNDGLFAIDMRDAAVGDYVILAKLSLSRRVFEIVRENKPTEENYSDELVLAYVTVGENSSVTVTDNRGETYCPTIDALGSISEKVKWAINYIENEIEAKLDEILSNLEEKSAEIDGKVEEANELISQLSPPAVGTIQFSASQNVGDEWLRCDGSFVNEADYPELVAALGKLTPSTTQWDILSQEEMGTDITNGVTYNGKVWVYSWAAKKLYGVDVNGEEPIKEIPVTSTEAEFDNMVSPYNVPTALSIVGDTLFLVQIRSSGSVDEHPGDLTFLAHKNFLGSESNITLEKYFTTAYTESNWNPQIGMSCIPYIVGKSQSGEIREYYMASGVIGSDCHWWHWTEGATVPSHDSAYFYWAPQANDPKPIDGESKVAFNSKNQNEMIYGEADNNQNFYQLHSVPNGIYDSSQNSGEKEPVRPVTQSILRSAAVANDSVVLFDMYWDSAAKKFHIYASDRYEVVAHDITPSVSLPNYTMVLPDCAMYLRNKAIWLIFLGSGFLFSRDILQANSFGFLDTSQELGILTQYGQCWYDEAASKVYILGQSSDSKVTLATLQLPTLFNYANDGAWLPMIASDGVPAYIKAVSESS